MSLLFSVLGLFFLHLHRRSDLSFVLSEFGALASEYLEALLTRSDQIKTQQKLISYLLRCCISLFPQSRERGSITNHLITFASNGYERHSPYPRSPALHIKIKLNPAASVF